MKASLVKWPWLFQLAFVIGLFVVAEAHAELVKVRAGVLSYGTVNWELNVVKHHDLDRKEGVELLVTKLGGKNASAVALQGGAVDVIVTDWIWVSRQRAAGADFTFVPHSVAVGGLMVRPDSGIKTIGNLRGRKIGIAGGPVDKSWLMLRAYAQKSIGADLKDIAEPTFAAPPLPPFSNLFTTPPPLLRPPMSPFAIFFFGLVLKESQCVKVRHSSMNLCTLSDFLA